MKIGLIVLGGPIDEYEGLNSELEGIRPSRAFDFVVAVDGGMKHVNELGLKPDMLLGDFDSIADLNFYTDLWPEAVLKQFPTEKSMTDSELAFETLFKHSFDRVYVIGAFGGRIDHLVGNLALLKAYAKENIVLLDAFNRVCLLEGPCKLLLNRSEYFRKYVSILPVDSGVSGVNLKNFKYPLINAVIEFGSTLGISNEIVGDFAEVSIEAGSALLINSADRPI